MRQPLTGLVASIGMAVFGLSCSGGASRGTKGNGQTCTADSDCGTGACGTVASAKVCTDVCQSSDVCLPGWTCAAAPGGSVQACQCETPSAEACDGLDNDCNGTVDDEPAADASCAQQVPGESCNAGQCVCAGVLCAGACVDDQTDVNNCGGCNVICAGTCAAGRCVITLAANEASPFGIAVDSQSVYWTNYAANGTVKKVSLDGSNPMTLASGQGYPDALALDATYVYWANGADTGSIMKVALGGGTPIALATNRDSPTALAVSATNVYWAEGSGLAEVPLSGSTTPIVLWTGIGVTTAGVAVDARNVYVTVSDVGATGFVAQIPLNGLGETYLASNLDYPQGIAVDTTNVYWTNWMGATVSEEPIGGTGAAALASNQDDPYGIAIDATSVYWTTQGLNGSVLKVAISGGKPIVLATNQVYPTAIAVDATSVYWTNQGNSTGGTGSVMKTSK
jgi:hypothetical protein